MKVRNQTISAPMAKKLVLFGIPQIVLVVVVFIAAMCCAACMRNDPRAGFGPKTSRIESVLIEDAVHLAISKAREAGLLEGRKFRITAGYGVDRWVVTVQFLPRAADDELMIFVDSAGRVEGPWDKL